MKTVLRSVLAVILGFLVGSLVNMGLVMLGPHVIPPPAGADVTNVESMRASAHLFEPRHFVFPFLAHALGTLSGALVAYLLAVRSKPAFAYVIGALNLVGGIVAAFMIPAPVWFITVDLLFAYVPMACLAVTLARTLQPQPVATG